MNQLERAYLDQRSHFLQNTEVTHRASEAVAQRLQNNKLYEKPKKCEFHLAEVSILGFVIAQQRLHPYPVKISVEEWPTPSTWTQLQRFLGFAKFNQRIICDYS